MKKLLAALTLLLIAHDGVRLRSPPCRMEGAAQATCGAHQQRQRFPSGLCRLQNRPGGAEKYLDALSAVSEADYRRWSKPQQLAFLINAYNAYTVELILTRYPDLKSIKDLGSVLQSPWKKTFFTLLGQERSLDDVEHGLIRAPGAFDEPRIHAAVNCASIGCPMLRAEAFTADQLDAQLEDGMRRFLADRTRNRFDAAGNTLSVSKIFDWYQGDFEQGHQGFTSLDATFARYADALGDTPQARDAIRKGGSKIRYLDYDWALNATKR